MTVRDALKWGSLQLQRARVDSPGLDAEIFIAHSHTPLHLSSIEDKCNACTKGRAWLYSHPEHVLTSGEERRFRNFIRRRQKREPVAYIVGHREFYGLDFLVNRHVLVPRPETELLVELANVIIQSSNHPIIVVDVGTGSGAIVIAIAAEVAKPLSVVAWSRGAAVTLIATDISLDALRVAKQNARRHAVAERITFLRGNLLAPLLRSTSYLLRTKHFIITADLPYLPTAEWRATAPEIKKWEPRQALDGGRDGLKYYRELFNQVSGIRFQGSVLCEICPEQADAFKKLVTRFFPSATKFTIVKDIAGRNRVAIVRI